MWGLPLHSLCPHHAFLPCPCVAAGAVRASGLPHSSLSLGFPTGTTLWSVSVIISFQAARGCSISSKQVQSRLNHSISGTWGKSDENKMDMIPGCSGKVTTVQLQISFLSIVFRPFKFNSFSVQVDLSLPSCYLFIFCLSCFLFLFFSLPFFFSFGLFLDITLFIHCWIIGNSKFFNGCSRVYKHL